MPDESYYIIARGLLLMMQRVIVYQTESGVDGSFISELLKTNEVKCVPLCNNTVVSQ